MLPAFPKKLRIPKCKPRNLNRIPLNLSQRIGLRHVARIGKAPLHPSYVCWYNGCEACGDFSIPAAITCSVDGADKQEGSGSLQLVNNSAAVGDQHCTIDVDACGLYCGFWIKPNLNVNTSRSACRMWDAAGNFHGVYFVRQDGVLEYHMLHDIDDDDGYSNFDCGAFTNDTWMWGELRGGGTTFSLRIDGVPQHDFSRSGPMGDYDHFSVTQINGWKLATSKVDYVRIADRYEYPPE